MERKEVNKIEKKLKEVDEVARNASEAIRNLASSFDILCDLSGVDKNVFTEKWLIAALKGEIPVPKEVDLNKMSLDAIMRLKNENESTKNTFKSLKDRSDDFARVCDEKNKAIMNARHRMDYARHRLSGVGATYTMDFKKKYTHGDICDVVDQVNNHYQCIINDVLAVLTGTKDPE